MLRNTPLTRFVLNTERTPYSISVRFAIHQTEFDRLVTVVNALPSFAALGRMMTKGIKKSTTRSKARAAQLPEMPAPRKMLRIFVTPNAKEAVEKVVERDGMTEIEVASRIYLWFSQQPEPLQHLILGHVSPEMVGNALELIARHFKSGHDDEMSG